MKNLDALVSRLARAASNPPRVELLMPAAQRAVAKATRDLVRLDPTRRTMFRVDITGDKIRIAATTVSARSRNAGRPASSRVNVSQVVDRRLREEVTAERAALAAKLRDGLA